MPLPPIVRTFFPQNVVVEYPIGTVIKDSDVVVENTYDEHVDGSVVSSHITVSRELHDANAYSYIDETLVGIVIDDKAEELNEYLPMYVNDVGNVIDPNAPQS